MRFTVPYRPLAALALACALLAWPATADASKSLEGTVPQAASALARQIDRQIAARLQQPDTPALGVSLAVTVPADLNDLDDSNALARQMSEDLARWFVQAGYSVQEIRKGRDLLFEPESGEKLLTRRADLLSSESVTSTAILVGTYTVTSKNVRFNIRVIQTANREVLGMATISVPVTSELRALLNGKGGFNAAPLVEPTVRTTLP